MVTEEIMDKESLLNNEIIITKFFNPYNYFFIYKEDLPCRDKITQCIISDVKNFSRNMTPMENQEAIVLFKKTFYRAVILSVQKETEKLICWLKDFGIFVLAESPYFIPEYLLKQPALVHKACMYGLCSEKTYFDIKTNENVKVDLSSWDESLGPCQLKYFKNPRNRFYLNERYQLGNVYFIGDLFCQNDEGIYNTVDRFIATGYASYNEEKFINVLPEESISLDDLKYDFEDDPKIECSFNNEDEANIALFDIHSKSRYPVPKIFKTKLVYKYPMAVKNSKILLHTKMDLKQGTNSNIFHANISNIMKVYKRSNPLLTQLYTWPAIIRNDHVFLIAPNDSGKTLAYLPAILSLLLCRSPYIQPNVGPFAIILCTDIINVESVKRQYDMFNTLNFKTCFLTKFRKELLKEIVSADILVSTPLNLIKIFREKVIRFRKVQHVVIENCEILLDLFQPELLFLLISWNHDNKLRPFDQQIQMIVTGSKWTLHVDRLAQRFLKEPTICITEPLEAAMYGRCRTLIHAVTTAKKATYLLNLMRKRQNNIKTIIICKNIEEIKCVQNNLLMYDFSHTTITEDTSDEIRNNFLEYWACKDKHYQSILVCTDAILKLDVPIDAYLIIQYSASDCSTMSARYSPFMNNYSYPYLKHTNSCHINQCEMHIFVDEKTKNNPHICRFMKYLNGTAKDFDLANDDVELCPNQLNYGYCSVGRYCKFVHEFDNLNTAEHLPCSGRVKFQVLHIVSPVNYICRIIEYIDINGVKSNSLYEYEKLQNLITVSVQNSKPEQHIFEGSFYIVKTNKFTERCKILKKHDDKIKIYLVDDGVETDVTEAEFYSGNEELWSIPFQMVKVIIPYFGPIGYSCEWEKEIVKNFHRKLEYLDAFETKFFFMAIIDLRIDDTIYLSNVGIYKDVDSSVGIVHLRVADIDSILLDNEFGEKKPKVLHNLYELCIDKGLLQFPNYNVSLYRTTLVVGQPRFKWLTLEVNKDYLVKITHVVTSDQFYVTVSYEDYDKKIKDLQNSITEYVNSNFVNMQDRDPLYLNGCYAVKHPETSSEIYHRAIIINFPENNMATCYFVDVGAIVTVDYGSIYPILNKHITSVSFQAIECCLSPDDSIATELDDILYEDDVEISVQMYAKGVLTLRRFSVDMSPIIS